MPKIDDQIATLQEKLKRLKGRQQNIESRKQTIQVRRDRKLDTRRKNLVGAVVLAKIEQQVFDEKLLRAWLEDALTRAEDRALFDLATKS